MIGVLQGKPIISSDPAVIIMTGGVGYQVYITSKLKEKLAKKNEVFLNIYTHVREENLDLYGFEDREEMTLFKMLLSVSGVGPRTALNVLNEGVEKIKKAVISADTGFFTLIPRLGKKNAQKIIIELKGKLGSLEEINLSDDSIESNNEVVLALVGMGFVKNEILKALRKSPEEIVTVEDKIRYCLKLLAK